MRHYQRGIATSVILIIFLLTGIAVASGAFVFSQKQQQIKAVNSFEDCAKYYPVMESYPEQCNTPNGKHFVRQLSEEEKQKLLPPQNTEDLASMSKYCTSYSSTKPAQSVRDCGDFIVLKGPCCDQGDIILDKTGKEIAKCGGFASYSEECKKFLPQNQCLETQCNPEY